jgi:hypothetical protein
MGVTDTVGGSDFSQVSAPQKRAINLEAKRPDIRSERVSDCALCCSSETWRK